MPQANRFLVQVPRYPVKKFAPLEISRNFPVPTFEIVYPGSYNCMHTRYSRSICFGCCSKIPQIQQIGIEIANYSYSVSTIRYPVIFGTPNNSTIRYPTFFTESDLYEFVNDSSVRTIVCNCMLGTSGRFK